MTANTAKPVAPSGFRPNLATITGPNGDVAEYITPEASGVDTGFYVTDRGLPWHVTLSRRLDTPELMTGTDSKLTSKEALVIAGLAYDVQLLPLKVMLGRDKHSKPILVDAPGKFATVRMDTNAVLGVGMSKGFKVVQNADAFAFADAIVGEHGANWETAAALYGGRQVFLSMELPDDIHIDGDPSDYRLFLVISNGHDGRHMLRADVTVERVVCRNTLRIAQKGAKSNWAIKHTSSIEGRVFEARHALGLSLRYAETFTANAQRLIDTPLAERQVEAILLDAFPLTERQEEAIDKDPAKVLSTTYGKVVDLYRTSPTVEPIRGTAYGVFNAVTEYADHIKAYSGRGDTTSEDVKLDNLMNDGAGSSIKQAVWDLLMKAAV